MPMVISVNYLVISLYTGEGECGICTGNCCPLVNMTLKSLVDIGELPMNTEVPNLVKLKLLTESCLGH